MNEKEIRDAWEEACKFVGVDFPLGNTIDVKENGHNTRAIFSETTVYIEDYTDEVHLEVYSARIDEGTCLWGTNLTDAIIQTLLSLKKRGEI